MMLGQKHTLRTAIFPIAGRGSRLLPLTKAVNKALLAVYDQSLLFYGIAEARQCGVERFVFIVNKGDDSLTAYLHADADLEAYLRAKGGSHAQAVLGFLADIAYVKEHAVIIEQETPRGLGDAVLLAENHVLGDVFAVILVDDFIYHSQSSCLQQLVDGWQQHNEHAGWIAVEQVDAHLVDRYGIVVPQERDGANELGQGFALAGLVEKPSVATAPSRWAIVGRYVLPRTVMSFWHASKAAWREKSR